MGIKKNFIPSDREPRNSQKIVVPEGKKKKRIFKLVKGKTKKSL